MCDRYSLGNYMGTDNKGVVFSEDDNEHTKKKDVNEELLMAIYICGMKHSII